MGQKLLFHNNGSIGWFTNYEIAEVFMSWGYWSL